MTAERDMKRFDAWVVSSDEHGKDVVDASCARLAAHAWGKRNLRLVGEVHSVTVTGKYRNYGPFRVERVTGGAVYAGPAKDTSPAPRWKLAR